MGPIDALIHLLNFAAPALVVGVLTALAARVFMPKRSSISWYVQAAINGLACLAALFAGLWFFGHDGKMASYALLVLACASSQWCMVRG